MARAAQWVINLARQHLHDDQKGRYADGWLLPFVQTGLDELRTRRPDLFIGRLLESVPDLALDTLIDLPDRHLQQLADAVAARAQLRDDDVTVDGSKAQVMLGLAGRS